MNNFLSPDPKFLLVEGKRFIDLILALRIKFGDTLRTLLMGLSVGLLRLLLELYIELFCFKFLRLSLIKGISGHLFLEISTGALGCCLIGEYELLILLNFVNLILILLELSLLKILEGLLCIILFLIVTLQSLKTKLMLPCGMSFIDFWSAR